jgi:hypothetical protein
VAVAQIAKEVMDHSPCVFVRRRRSLEQGGLRLERTGDLVTASISPDGLAWYAVVQDIIQLPPDVLIGLAVTSHDRTRLASAAFGSVAVNSSD